MNDMIEKLQLALSGEELEELCVSDKTAGESLSALRMLLSMVDTLCIQPGQDILVSRWFEEGEGKRWKPYVKGFSYEVLEEVENKITDFLFDGKAYRLYIITRADEREAVSVITPYYIRTIENVVLKNPRLPRDYFQGKEDMQLNLSLSSLLESIDLGDCDMGNVKDMHALFFMCGGLRHIGLSGIDTSNVSEMELMFNGCNSLTSLDLSGLDTGNVDDISFMFDGCCSLETLDLSGWDLTNLTFLTDAFNGCTSLREVYMVGCDAHTVAIIAKALAAAKIPEKIIKRKK